MRTDELFYEFFKLAPEALIKLVQLNLEGHYSFESVTLKRIERRMDGLFKRTDGEGPHLFLEVQGYEDEKIYWRLFHEITTYYMQNEDKKPFIGILLFVDEKYDPDESPFSCLPPHQLIRANLVESLKQARESHKALIVLEPLILEDKEELAEKTVQWRETLETIDLPERQKQNLIELLTYAILEKFSELTIEEIRKMLKLTPLEETTAGKELLQIGREEGLNKGELIGQIHFAQRMLKQSLTPKEELSTKGKEELQAILHELESQLNLS